MVIPLLPMQRRIHSLEEQLETMHDRNSCLCQRIEDCTEAEVCLNAKLLYAEAEVAESRRFNGVESSERRRFADMWQRTVAQQDKKEEALARLTQELAEGKQQQSRLRSDLMQAREQNRTLRIQLQKKSREAEQNTRS